MVVSCLVAAIFVYANSLSDAFVMDDMSWITQNPEHSTFVADLAGVGAGG